MTRIHVSALIALAALLQATSDSPRRRDDPAPLRLELLSAMDAQIDAEAARAHIQARLMLDEALPMAFLGVVPEEDPALGGEGLRITQVYRDSGAEAAGLQVGDVLLELEGLRITGRDMLYTDIRRFRPGDTVQLLVRRDGGERVLRATFGKRWEEDEEDVEQYLDLAPPTFAPKGLPWSLDLAGADLGTTPPGIEQVLGGVGAPPGYVVEEVDGRRALRQSVSDRIGLRFPMALVEGVDVHDVVGRVRFRLVAGAQDRCAGILLHWKDENNYLVARANAVEGDMRIFRTVNGLRRTLPGGVAMVDLDDDEWHTLEFRVEGPKVTATLDGEVTCSSYDTFFPHGRVGLWTKSDAVTDFAELSLTAP
jgi:hypothetical protein